MFRFYAPESNNGWQHVSCTFCPKSNIFETVYIDGVMQIHVVHEARAVGYMRNENYAGNVCDFHARMFLKNDSVSDALLREVALRPDAVLQRG